MATIKMKSFVPCSVCNNKYESIFGGEHAYIKSDYEQGNDCSGFLMYGDEPLTYKNVSDIMHRIEMNSFLQSQEKLILYFGYGSDMDGDQYELKYDILKHINKVHKDVPINLYDRKNTMVPRENLEICVCDECVKKYAHLVTQIVSSNACMGFVDDPALKLRGKDVAKYIRGEINLDYTEYEKFLEDMDV